MGISVHRAILEFPDYEHKPSNSMLLLEQQKHSSQLKNKHTMKGRYLKPISG